MEASTIPATAVLRTGRPSGAKIVAGPLLRLRSDEQLVRLFRAGSDEAFRVIHDRYRTRLLAYARQMLGGARADADDVLQDVFVRAYGALLANDRDVSLRAWLYRIAHNRCIDELRRAAGIGPAHPAPSEVLELVHAPAADPMDAVERRESLRRLVADVQRLPDQQRSALLMREMSGMAYQDLATALDVTVPAVKSLLVRARIGLAQAAEARDTACAAIRADLADAHERGVRASGLVRRHLHDCKACGAYRRELRALDARLAALVPAVGPVAFVAKLLGVVGGGGSTGVAGGGAGGTAVGGAVAATAAGGGAAAATAGIGTAGIGVTHIAAAVAVAVVSAGGAVEVHQSLIAQAPPAAVTRHVLVLPATTSQTPFASGARAVPAAQLRHDNAMRLKLRIAPDLSGRTVAASPPVLTPAVPGPANGGAAAPPEPADSSTAPVTPAPDAGAPPDASQPVVGATSGSSSPPPPPPAPVPTPADPSAPATTTPIDPAPPATSVAPAAAPTTPPTSASTGGATYRPHR